MLTYTMPVTRTLAEALEAHFCEEYQQCWMLNEDWRTGEQELVGYFETPEAAATEFAALQGVFAELPALPPAVELADQDWKEAYKLHFKPWSDRGLHFVPLWEKENYVVPAGEAVIYLDPGMAFGTGNHETTRLCLRRLLDAREAWLGADGQLSLERDGRCVTRSVLDAGCGSGILAIGAAKLGFHPIHGFDNDPDSVVISGDNARLCEVDGQVSWQWAGLDEGLEGRTADLVMANILANVLLQYQAPLLQAVESGGWLVLSGILAKEVEDVAIAFAASAKTIWGVEVTPDLRREGDWADVCLARP